MKFNFEGEQLTISEIRKRVPILANNTIRSHLNAGRNTRISMLSYDPKIGMAKGGQRAARKSARTHGYVR
ncbi:hypothetical protein [Lysobacter rhizosphaerae]